MRFALVCLLIALTGAVPATPSFTAQDLIDVSDGAIDPESLTSSMATADRVRAIHKLIRAGASCKRLVSEECVSTIDFEAPRAKDTAKSPCFRRWALYTLLFGFPIDDVIDLDAKELRSAAKLDDEVLAYLGQLLDEQQQVELAHMLVQQKRTPSFELFLDHAAAVRAVKQYHLDLAVDELDPDQDRKLLIGVILDPTYKAETRVAAIGTLNSSDIDFDWFAHILMPLLADPSIDVAVEVAGVTGTRPMRPPTRDASVFMHALAVFAASGLIDDIDALHTVPTDEDAARSFAPLGLQIVSPTGVTVEHIAPDEELAEALRDRMHLPPLFGTDQRGQIILVGFVDVALPEALDESACELEGL